MRSAASPRCAYSSNWACSEQSSRHKFLVPLDVPLAVAEGQLADSWTRLAIMIVSNQQFASRYQLSKFVVLGRPTTGGRAELREASQIHAVLRSSNTTGYPISAPTFPGIAHNVGLATDTNQAAQRD